MNTNEVDAHASTEIDRRRMLKVGTAGVVAAGAIAAGGPQVLGLGASPAYAAGTSSPGPTTTTTLPPNQSSILAQVNLLDDGGQYDLPATYTTFVAHLFDAATGGNIIGTATVTAVGGNSNMAWSFYNLSAGTYWVDFTESLNALLAEIPETSAAQFPAGRQQVVVTSVSNGYNVFVDATLS